MAEDKRDLRTLVERIEALEECCGLKEKGKAADSPETLRLRRAQPAEKKDRKSAAAEKKAAAAAK